MTKKVKLISNLIIAIVITCVCAVGFYSSATTTIYSPSAESVIYNGNKNSNSVSLMFNVYENTEVVEGILKVLSNEGVTCTFFVGGCWADDNQSTLNKIIENGHELGNHGYFHKDHKKISYEENLREISDCDKIVSALTGYKMNLFAPPSGAYSKNTLKVASELNYKTIMWSKDTIDWRDSDKDLKLKRATEKIVGGDLVLLHPKQHTLDVLPDIIKEIKGKKLNVTTVSNCVFNGV